MTEETYHVTLMAKSGNTYEKFVFKTDEEKYILCTRLPNWGNLDMKIGDTGFATIFETKAGEEYFDRNTEIKRVYYYTNVYLKDFIKDMKKGKIII